MNRVARNIKGIMVVSGALTMTMAYAALSPAKALQSTFGEALTGPATELVVRSWAILITLVGLMLIYGAFNIAARQIALFAAGLSKLAFVSLVLSNGTHFLRYGAGVAVVIDGLTVFLFAMYLVATSREEGRAQAAI